MYLYSYNECILSFISDLYRCLRSFLIINFLIYLILHRHFKSDFGRPKQLPKKIKNELVIVL